MVIKLEWNRYDYNEYKDAYFEVTSVATIQTYIGYCVIDIDERVYMNQHETHTFNNATIQSSNPRPFPEKGVVFLKCLDLGIAFPDIKNRLSFTDKIIEYVENSEEYEGSIGIDLLDIGESKINGLDLNDNQTRRYKFIRIL